MADRPYMCRDEGLFLPECDDCSQLEGRVKALEDCCETATEELADHEERISSAENTLTNHTQTLSEQNTRITANSNSISANTQSIGQAESEINSVKSRVTTAESDIDTLQEDLMSAQSDIQSNTDAIDSIERLPEVTSADDGKVLTVVDGKWGIKPSSLVGEAIVGQSTVGGGNNIFDIIYPIGSYYETSDSTFDPNTAWGGTWTSEQIKDDKIVDEGESGIWTYRKWKSGVAECWGTYSGSITSRTTNAPYNSPVFDIGTVAYPTGFFADVPNVNVNTRIGAHYNLTSYANSYRENVSISITASVTETQTVQAYIQSKGIWKSYVQPQTLYKWHRTA